MNLTLPIKESLVRRTMDATLLNRVANDPAVRPWLGGEGVIDLTATLLNPDHISVVAEHGGFVCFGQGGGRYEVHSMFLPTRATGETVRAMRSAVDYFFTATDGWELITKVPQLNRGALGLARLAGFSRVWTTTLQWSQLERWLTDVMSLSIDKWAVTNPRAKTMGDWLHDAFEAAKPMDSTLPAHPMEEDDIHHQIAGAALLMVRDGNAVKAVTFYNRWAALSGYAPIRLVREHPTVLDLEGMWVEARGDSFEVLSCQ